MLNQIFLQGRLTKDVDLRYTRSEKAVAAFTVACDRDAKGSGTDFINCIAWEKTAQFIDQYFHKGDMILIQGRLDQRSWEDNNGNKRTVHEVRVSNVNFCGKKNGEAQKPNDSGFHEISDSDEELPF